LRKRLEALPPLERKYGMKLNPEKLSALVEFWPLAQHRALAEELGISHTTALRYYRKLTEKAKISER